MPFNYDKDKERKDTQGHKYNLNKKCGSFLDTNNPPPLNWSTLGVCLGGGGGGGDEGWECPNFRMGCQIPHNVGPIVVSFRKL